MRRACKRIENLFGFYCLAVWELDKWRSLGRFLGPEELWLRWWSAVNPKGNESALGIQEDIWHFTFQMILDFIFEISFAQIILHVLALDIDFVMAL